MQANYRWKDGAHAPPVSAVVFGTTLETIEQRHGSVTPAAVVAAARSPTSPIHAAFNWNDAEAAEKYREEQARLFIRSLTVVRVKIEGGKQVDVREWFSVRTGADDARAYASRPRVMSSEDLRRQVISEAKRDLDAYLTRFSAILAASEALPHLRKAAAALDEEIAGAVAARRPDTPKTPAARAAARKPQKEDRHEQVV